jgi:hypothetical protein
VLHVELPPEGVPGGVASKWTQDLFFFDVRYIIMAGWLAGCGYTQ